MKAAVYIHSLNRIEQERKLFQNIRIMEDKIRGGSTLKVVITAADGNIHEFTDKIPMEKVIAASNEKQWHIAEGGSQLHDTQFVNKLGTYGDGTENRKVMDGNFVFPPDTSVDTKYFINACIKLNTTAEQDIEPSVRSRLRSNIKSWRV